MLFSKHPQIRRFTYSPKYYKPQEDKEEDGPRIKFRRYRQSQPRKRRSMLVMAVLVLILLYFLCYWFQGEKKEPAQEFKFELVDPNELK